MTEASVKATGAGEATDISPALERKIFVRFWTWLGIVAGVLFTIAGVTAGAIGFWISGHLTTVGEKANLTAASAANAAVEAKASAIASRLEDVIRRTTSLHDASFILATEMGSSKGVSLEYLRSIKSHMEESTQLLSALRASAALSGDRSAGLNQTEIVAALGNNADFARLVSSGLPLLSGAVLAFDTPGCPQGWQSFADSGGRFIIGSSAQRPYRSLGGSDSVVLSLTNLPEHSHETLVGVLQNSSPFGHSAAPNPQAIFGTRQGPTFVANTAPAGLAKPTPIGIVPPFIALTLCRKS